MRYSLLLLPVCLVLLTAFTTPAAAPGPEMVQQTATVSSMTISPVAKSKLTASTGRSTIRLKVVRTNHSYQKKSTKHLKPVSSASKLQSPVATLNNNASRLSSENFACGSMPQRAPLSLQQSAPDYRQIASLSAKRLLSLAQRDITTPRFHELITV